MNHCTEACCEACAVGFHTAPSWKPADHMIAMEDKRRDEIEKDIAAMEIEERQHIDRLRALQEEQKIAYDELEQALAGP